MSENIETCEGCGTTDFEYYKEVGLICLPCVKEALLWASARAKESAIVDAEIKKTNLWKKIHENDETNQNLN